jgi:hypothetical protein
MQSGTSSGEADSRLPRGSWRGPPPELMARDHRERPPCLVDPGRQRVTIDDRDAAMRDESHAGDGRRRRAQPGLRRVAGRGTGAAGGARAGGASG